MVTTKRICLTIKASLVGDQFLYSHDLDVCFRGDMIGENSYLSLLGVKGLLRIPKVKQSSYSKCDLFMTCIKFLISFQFSHTSNFFEIQCMSTL